MLLWPRSCFTYRMSFVLWYSMVAFQWRRVWKVMQFMRGFCSLLAILFRCLRKLLPRCLRDPANTSCDVLGNALSIAINSAEIFRTLGSLPFSGVTDMVLVSKLKSIHSSCQASPLLTPVSLRSFRKVEVFRLHPAISWLTSSSVGMKGNFLTRLYFGGFHVSPSILRKVV